MGIFYSIALFVEMSPKMAWQIAASIEHTLNIPMV